MKFIQASHPSSKIKTAPNFPLCYFLFVVKGAVFFRRFIFGRHVIQPGPSGCFPQGANTMKLAEKAVVDVLGGIDASFSRQSSSSGFFKIILISICSLAFAGAGCGGSEKEKEDNGPGEDVEFVGIPGGSFVLSHETALYNSGDTVTLNAFELKKTPVTVAEFEKCVLAK